MPLTTNIQLQIIFYSIVAGIMIGILFDLHRIIRGKNTQKIITVIEDMLFGILSAITIFTFLLYKNYAFLGVYVYTFIILSFLIYLKFISNAIMKIEILLLQKIGKMFRVIIKNFIYPFRIIMNNISGKK